MNVFRCLALMKALGVLKGKFEVSAQGWLYKALEQKRGQTIYYLPDLNFYAITFVHLDPVYRYHRNNVLNSSQSMQICIKNDLRVDTHRLPMKICM